MRLTWLPLALLLAAPAMPARAATQQIRLQFISPIELEQILSTSSTPQSLGQAGQVKDADGLGIAPPLHTTGPRGVWGLVPENITGLSSDTRTKSLWVTGTEDAIQVLRNIIRLIDIPARRVRIALHVVRPDAAALEGVKLEDLTTAGSPVRMAVLDEAQAAKLTVGDRLLSADLTTTNNRAAQFFLPAAAGLGRRASVTPRINGDGTITLIALTASGQDGAAAASTAYALRRINSGQTALMLTKDGAAVLIRAEILPEPVAAEARARAASSRR